MKFTEPMTMVTDYVMGALALVLAVRLIRTGAFAGQTPVWVWGLAFVATASASFFGGTYHGFIQILPMGAARVLWRITLISTGIGSACLLAAVTQAGTTGWIQRVLFAVIVVKLAVYVLWMSTHDDFIFVIADYGSALLLVLVLAWLPSTGGLGAAAPWITAGVGVSVVAALIQAFTLAPHPQFNHNDLFHVVQMGALYLLYRGGLLLRVTGAS